MPHRIRKDHCIEKMDKDWIINALKLEWIESDRIEFKIGLDSLLNQSINQSIIPWLFINQSQTMDLAI